MKWGIAMRNFIKNFMSDSRKIWLLFILLTGGQFVVSLFSFNVGLSPLNWLFFIFWLIALEVNIRQQLCQRINKIFILFIILLLLAVLVCNFSIHGYYKFAQNIIQSFTDEHIKIIDTKVEAKEKEIMTI